MRPSSFIFILLLPAFIALGHDMFLFYVNYISLEGLSLDLILQEFKFSAFGFIWTTYDEEGYKNFVRSTDPQTWAIIDSLLTFKAFYTGLAFAGIMVCLFYLLGFFKIGPFAREGKVFYGKYDQKGKKKDVSFRGGQGSGKIEYKRK